MKKILRIFLIIVLITFVLIQFVRPPKNTGEEIAQNYISSAFQIPDDVQQILKVSCYDCHSNTTHYPWYSSIQPVAWFLNDHIIEGKRELNFSAFATYPLRRQYKKLKEIGREVKEGDMPMFSYTLLHRDAALNQDQKSALQNWAAATMKGMEAKYPADSLVKPK